HSLALVFYCPALPRHLPSFPTRRSSDLGQMTGHGVQPVVQLAAEGEDLLRGIGELVLPPAELDRAQQSEQGGRGGDEHAPGEGVDRKSTRLNSSHVKISYAVFCLKKKKH